MLILPRLFGCAFKPNEKFALEVEDFVEIGEEEVNCVLVDDVALGESSSVFLRNAS